MVGAAGGKQPHDPEGCDQATKLSYLLALAWTQAETAEEGFGVDARMRPDRYVLDEVGKLARPIAAPGFLEADQAHFAPASRSALMGSGASPGAYCASRFSACHSRLGSSPWSRSSPWSQDRKRLTATPSSKTTPCVTNPRGLDGPMSAGMRASMSARTISLDLEAPGCALPATRLGLLHAGARHATATA